jgi:chemotaxis protein MotB
MAARRKRHQDHEEHENHERWLITYADMITLLMVLFIVLYAISQVDLAKFEKFKSGLTKSFGARAEVGLMDGNPSLLTGEGSLDPLLLQEAGEALDQTREEAKRSAEEQARLRDAEHEIAEGLGAIGLAGAVKFRYEDRGLVVTIVTDQVLFAPGSGDLTDEGHRLLGQLAGPLAELPNPLSIEGHTDPVPISNARYPSNWELSTARATIVLREFLDRHGIPADRLAAAGYADTKPVADNGTAAGRQANRRVEVVVIATASEPTVADPIDPHFDTPLGVQPASRPTNDHADHD